MKLEELTQEALDDLVKSVESAQSSIQGLKADLSKAKAKAKGADIDPEAHAALQTQVEELTSKLETATKTSQREIEKLTKSLTEKDSALTTHLIDAGLVDGLAKSGVKPEFMDACKALLKSKTAIKSEGGNYIPMLGDKPLADGLKEWVSSDTGKHFVAAPVNTGGGATGGSTSSGKKTITRSQFAAMPPTEQAAAGMASAKGEMVIVD